MYYRGRETRLQKDRKRNFYVNTFIISERVARKRDHRKIRWTSNKNKEEKGKAPKPFPLTAIKNFIGSRLMSISCHGRGRTGVAARLDAGVFPPQQVLWSALSTRVGGRKHLLASGHWVNWVRNLCFDIFLTVNIHVFSGYWAGKQINRYTCKFYVRLTWMILQKLKD